MKTYLMPILIGLSLTTYTFAEDDADNICKDAEQSVCEQNAEQCVWVETYIRQDNVTVDAYCRKKPSSSAEDTAETAAE